MNNNYSIIWENNQYPASNYEEYDVIIDRKLYNKTVKQDFWKTALLTVIILSNESDKNLDQYNKVVYNLDCYQYNDVTNFSKDVKENLMKKKKINSSIDYFVSLDNNWDGYGAIPLGVECAKIAKEFISLIPNESFKFFYDGFPNTHGTISFEWKNSISDEFFVEIGSQTLSYCLLKNGETPVFENNVKNDNFVYNKMIKLINNIDDFNSSSY